MSDNLFDRLFELFQTTDPVNWALSEEIVKSVAGERQPIDPQLAEEYQELSLAAQLQLSASGALDAASSTIPDPVDPAGWALANHRSYGYLMLPLAEALGGSDPANPMAAVMGPIGPAISGLQAGSMVGTMSTRTMGQFDAALPPLDQAKAYLVVPNVEAFAVEHGLDPRQVRLWANMRELLTHDLLSRDTVRTGLEGAARRLADSIDFDPSRLMEKLGELQDPGALDAMLGTGDGVAGLFGAGDGSDPSAADLEALAAFLEGYTDWVVRNTAGPMLPDIGAIERAFSERREVSDEAFEQLKGLVGLEIDRSLATDGAAFCDEVLRRWGGSALDRVWEDPEHLPRAGDLTDPVGWAARALLD